MKSKLSLLCTCLICYLLSGEMKCPCDLWKSYWWAANILINPLYWLKTQLQKSSFVIGSLVNSLHSGWPPPPPTWWKAISFLQDLPNTCLVIYELPKMLIYGFYKIYSGTLWHQKISNKLFCVNFYLTRRFLLIFFPIMSCASRLCKLQGVIICIRLGLAHLPPSSYCIFFSCVLKSLLMSAQHLWLRANLKPCFLEISWHLSLAVKCDNIVKQFRPSW